MDKLLLTCITNWVKSKDVDSDNIDGIVTQIYEEAKSHGCTDDEELQDGVICDLAISLGL